MVGRAAAVVLFVLAREAIADIATNMSFTETGGLVQVATSATRLFDAAAFEKLDAGFPTVVVLNVALFKLGGAKPEREFTLRRQAIYDMWDERYLVQLTQGQQSRNVRVVYRADALRLLTDIDALTIGTATQLPLGQTYQLKLRATLNPVSRDAVRQAREWLSAGAGGGVDRGGSFFGSLVSVFMRADGIAADRELVFVSQPFYRIGAP